MKLTCLAIVLASGNAFEPPFFRSLSEERADDGVIVIGTADADPLQVLGFEGSFYTRTTDGQYHFLSAGRLAATPGWEFNDLTDVHMRFDHWVSPDGRQWSHDAKLYESSGIFDGSDRKGSTWAPMAAFNEEDDRWHLFYVAYRASPDYTIKLGLYNNTALHYYVQWDGMINHAVSMTPGEGGLGGPFEDVGPVLDQETHGGFDVSLDSWEGDHGVDMFFPFQLDNGTWAALYGSEFGRFPNFCEPACRQVGLALWEDKARFSLQDSGRMRRVREVSPLDRGFRDPIPGVENPVVTKTMDGSAFIAVYHVYTPGAIGVSYSEDGVHWTRQDGDLMLRFAGSGADYCSTDVTTACGLVPEPSLGRGVYSVMYTAGAAGAAPGTENPGVVCRGYLENVAERDAMDVVLV